MSAHNPTTTLQTPSHPSPKPDEVAGEFAKTGGWPEMPRTEPSMRQTLPGQVIMLPGLGTDAELLWPQFRAYGDAIYCPLWRQPEPNEALDHYARRWAEKLEPELPTNKPVYLAGVSFGGMVALEMARHLNPRATLLIASARSAEGLSNRVHLMARLAGLTPTHVLQRLAPSAALAFACREQLDDRGFALIRRQARRLDPGFCKWALQAMDHWDFDGRLSDAQRPLHQIHGRWDWILPPRVEDLDHLIPDGRHLINLTHPQTINGFLADCAWAHVTEADNVGPRWQYF